MNGSGSAAPSAASASDRNCLMASCSEAAMSSASLRRSWRTASRATLDGCVVANSAATRRATVAVRTLITVPRSTRAKTASTMAMNTPSITGEPVTQAIKAATKLAAVTTAAVPTLASVPNPFRLITSG